MKAYDYVHSHAGDLGLQLQPKKCHVYLPPVSGQPTSYESHSAIDAVERECQKRGLTMQRTMETLGVMFGSEQDVEQFCNEAATESKEFFAALTHPELHTQMAMSLIRCCAIPKMGFLARTIHPQRINSAAIRFDETARDTTLEVLGLTQSLTQLALGDGNENGRVHEKNARTCEVSKQELLIRMRLPISLGGLGIRSLHSIRHASYFASLLQSLAEFLRIFPTAQVHGDHAAVPPDIARSQIFADLVECRNQLSESNTGKGIDLLSKKRKLVVQRSKSTPITANANSKLPALAANSNSSSSLPALHTSTDELWMMASKHAKESVCTSLAMAHKLQKQLTDEAELTLFDDFMLTSSAYQRAAVKSLMQPNSSVWMTILPSETAYCLNNEQYRLAVRHRLGMLPYDDLRDDVCIACARRNKDIPSFSGDPDHFHEGIKETGASVSRRHHRIAHTLGHLAHSVGFIVTHEPPFASALASEVNSETGEVHEYVVDNNQRGDILLVRHNDRLLVDVTVPRPTGITEMRLRDPKAAHASATAAEKRKHAKYDAACAREGLKMVPFALESYGALGSEGRKLVLKLAEASQDISAADFIRHANAAISVALQCGNAEISAQGTQRLRVSQVAQQSSMVSHTPSSAGRNKQMRLQQNQAESSINCNFHAHFEATAAKRQWHSYGAR